MQTGKWFSDILFVSCSNSFPMNPEKKMLIPYINNVSNKDPFLNSPRKVIIKNSNCNRPLRYLIPQVVKVELPYATNWRDFIYFF